MEFSIQGSMWYFLLLFSSFLTKILNSINASWLATPQHLQYSVLGRGSRQDSSVGHSLFGSDQYV